MGLIWGILEDCRGQSRSYRLLVWALSSDPYKLTATPFVKHVPNKPGPYVRSLQERQGPHSIVDDIVFYDLICKDQRPRKYGSVRLHAGFLSSTVAAHRRHPLDRGYAIPALLPRIFCGVSGHRLPVRHPWRRSRLSQLPTGRPLGRSKK